MTAAGSPRGAREPAWALVPALAALGAFALLAVAAAGHGPLPLDDGLRAIVDAIPVPATAWRLVTQGGGGLVLLLLSVAILGIIAARRPRVALVVAVALVAMSLGTDLVKVIVARPRPPGANPALFSGYSFPSGHALQSTVVYGLTALIAWHGRHSTPAWAGIAVIASALALLVGLSRVALGVHYPSDVVGGWAAGIAIVACLAPVVLPLRHSAAGT